MILLAILLGLFLQAPPPPQPSIAVDLSGLVDAARRAFVDRRFVGLFDDRAPVRLELPNQPAAVSVQGRVAAAALDALVRRTEDLAVDGAGAAVVAPGHGYVELRRVFRTRGTSERHTQRILISARLEEGRWRIAEIWVAAAIVTPP